MTMLLTHLLFVSWSIFPHGDLDQRIAELSTLIATYPDSIELHLKRGEAYLQHEEFAKAKQDFSYCLLHKFSNNYVFMGLAEAYLNEGLPDSSIWYCELVLSLEKNNFSALELYAKALLKSDQYCAAASAFENIIAIAADPSPMLFIQASSAFMFCNSEGSTGKAILILRHGLERMPDNPVLKKHLAGVYKKAEIYEEALEMQSQIISHSHFKARPYIERAKTYIEISKPRDAVNDLIAALSHLQSLPSHKKELPFVEELKKEIENMLAAIEK